MPKMHFHIIWKYKKINSKQQYSLTQIKFPSPFQAFSRTEFFAEAGWMGRKIQIHSKERSEQTDRNMM